MPQYDVLPLQDLSRAPASPPASETSRVASLAEVLKSRLHGEVRFDAGSRALYATDLSIYRQPPIGVVIPKTIEDVVTTVEECRNHGVPIPQLISTAPSAGCSESSRCGRRRRGGRGCARPALVSKEEGTMAVTQKPIGVRTGRADRITDPHKTHPGMEAANPDSRVPPLSDVGSLPVFKYPFALANKRVYQGGWSREVTARELPIAKDLAGVNMRLEAGGIRELHWHKAAEWSIMLYGSARITAVDWDGRSFVRDVVEGDLWYFPTGIPHSIQGLGPDGAEFLLVFDDGQFSEHETVLLSELMAHTPREMVSKNFGIAARDLEGLPREEFFIFQAPVPEPLALDQQTAAGALGSSPFQFSFRPADLDPARKTAGGEVTIVDSSTFQASTTVAVAIATVHPGGMRELHWHPNADEWQYYISGKARMTVVGTGARARTMDFEAGDVGFIEKTMPHYIDNTGHEDLRFIEVFRSSRFQDLSLSEWLAHTPPELVMAHLNIDEATYQRIPGQKAVVLPR